MKEKGLLILVSSLLFFLLSVESYLVYLKPVPPAPIAVDVLSFTHIPYELRANYFSTKAIETKNSYWVMRTLEEVEKAIIRQPTIGYLWEWDARLRKYLGMRYKDFFWMSIWIDPFRIDPAEVLNYVSAVDLISERNLLYHMTSFYGSWRFITKILDKLWKDKKGKQFLLQWEPEKAKVNGVLALFLAKKGVIDRSIYLAKKTFTSTPSLAYPALSYIVRQAFVYEQKGQTKEAEKLYLRVFAIAPGADNLPLRIVMFYVKQKNMRKAKKFYDFYMLNSNKFPSVKRLKNIIKKKGVFK